MQHVLWTEDGVDLAHTNSVCFSCSGNLLQMDQLGNLNNCDLAEVDWEYATLIL